MLDRYPSHAAYSKSATFATHRNTRIRVGPQNIAQQSGIGHIAGTLNVGNLLHLGKLRTQSTVHANDFIINDRRTGQAIEGVAELLPHFDRIAATALVVETVNAVDAGALVVAAEQKEIFGVLDFVGKQQAHHFQRLFSAIDVISEKEIVGLSNNNSSNTKKKDR